MAAKFEIDTKYLDQMKTIPLALQKQKIPYPPFIRSLQHSVAHIACWRHHYWEHIISSNISWYIFPFCFSSHYSTCSYYQFQVETALVESAARWFNFASFILAIYPYPDQPFLSWINDITFWQHYIAALCNKIILKTTLVKPTVRYFNFSCLLACLHHS